MYRRLAGDIGDGLAGRALSQFKPQRAIPHVYGESKGRRECTQYHEAEGEGCAARENKNKCKMASTVATAPHPIAPAECSRAYDWCG
jgi:hypothetical protein